MTTDIPVVTTISKANVREVSNTNKNVQVAAIDSTYIDKSNCLLSKETLEVYGSQIGEISDIPDSIKYNPVGLLRNIWFRITPDYKVVDNVGINSKNARDIDVCLANYAYAVADEIGTGGYCYTGVKHAFLSAGILNDYADMPKGEARHSIEYFENNKDKFQRIDVTKDDLSKLPAGVILVYTEDKPDVPGHIAITNGNAQEMSDSTDNMGWLDKHPEGKVVAYKLTDGWVYNSTSKKLEFRNYMLINNSYNNKETPLRTISNVA